MSLTLVNLVSYKSLWVALGPAITDTDMLTFVASQSMFMAGLLTT